MSTPGFELKQPYYGSVTLPDTDADFGVSFSLTDITPWAFLLPEGMTMVKPQEIAAAINGVLAEHGWAPITFLGTPPDQPI
jgi:hypothetical protein